jgi:hypothetical protein
MRVRFGHRGFVAIVEGSEQQPRAKLGRCRNSSHPLSMTTIYDLGPQCLLGRDILDSTATLFHLESCLPPGP